MCDDARRIMYDAKGAARAMSISRASIFALIARGELASTIVAGRRLIEHDDLIALVNRMKEKSGVGTTTSPTPLRTAADATTAIP